jgi:hypothetical protein
MQRFAKSVGAAGLLLTALSLPGHAQTTTDSSAPRSASVLQPIRPGVGKELQSYVCFDATRFMTANRSIGESKRDNLPKGSFYSQLLSLEIRMPGLPEETQEQVMRHIAESLRLWYLACDNCGPGSAAVLRNGNKFWIIEDYLKAMQPQAPRVWTRVQLPGQPPPSNDTVVEVPPIRVEPKRFSGMFGRTTRDGRSQSKYVAIAKNDPLIVKFCSGAEVLSDEHLAAMSQVLCTQKRASTSYTLFQIEDGNTSCGRKGIIACGMHQLGIQFNVADFSFHSAFGEKQAVFGHGADSVDLLRVLIHETGHWIGFQHVEDRAGDIMLEKYNQNACISDQNAIDMHNLTLNGEASPRKPSPLRFE